MTGTALPHLYGPNMAVRTSVFQSGTRFDPSIGPRGLQLSDGQ